MSRPNPLARLLRPRSVAIVGAGPAPSLAANLLDNLTDFGFAGGIHLVSRRHAEIGGRACLAAIDDLPHGIDVALLMVPVAAVAEAVAALGRRGVGGAVAFASGFGELGEEGRRRQDEVTALARASGMALLGPNCLGLVNLVDGIPLTFERLAPAPPSGPGVAVIAQSGAMAGNVRMALLARRAPVAFAVSTGNEAVVGTEDVLDALVDDDAVRLFALFVEQIRDPAGFLALARRARDAGKPIVLLHPGRSARSRAAAVSHTGALAGDHAVMAAFVADAGVTLVGGLDELFDASALLVRWPVPPPAGAALMTNSGALRGLGLDVAAEIGLDLPPLAPATAERLAGVLPDFATVDNPLDVTAQGMANPELFGGAAAALLDDPGIGALLVAAMGGSPAQQMAKWGSLRPVLEGADKPVVLAYLGDAAPLAEAVPAETAAAGVPLFRSAERALRALGHGQTRGRRLAAGFAPRPALPGIRPVAGAGPMAEYRAKKVLSALGIAVPAGGLAADAEAAARIAAGIGYPVALKAQSAALGHKTELGAVALGIADEAELRAALAAMAARLAAAASELVLDGFLVEAMAPAGGVELIAGARREADWGPVLMVGLGGVWAEALEDTQLVPATADRPAIAAALRRLKGARVFEGLRGGAPLDTDALTDLLARLGDLVLANSGLLEADINPVMVYPKGQGVMALDALLVFEKKSRRAP